jgi:dipeptidyl aminopeptidase/acylaminoacyl peptidase
MAELGRARPVILAAIATILTANIAIVSADWANTARTQNMAIPATTETSLPSSGFVLFGKADTPFATPTVFAVRSNGTQLSPSSQPPVRTDRLWGGRAVATTDAPSARVAPNGRAVAFIDDSRAIAFMNSRGVIVRILPPPPGSGFDAFAWSPDGEQIAVVRTPRTSTGGRPGLFVMSVLGQPVHLVAAGEFRAVDWSHDGTRLAAVRADAYADNLWVFAVRDGKATQVTDAQPTTASFCNHTAPVRVRAVQPMWSPDDRQIAFLSNADHAATFGRTFDVKVAMADGSDVVNVHEAPVDSCERVSAASSELRPAEYVSLFGWQKRANMAA